MEEMIVCYNCGKQSTSIKYRIHKLIPENYTHGVFPKDLYDICICKSSNIYSCSAECSKFISDLKNVIVLNYCEHIGIDIKMLKYNKICSSLAKRILEKISNGKTENINKLKEQLSRIVKISIDEINDDYLQNLSLLENKSIEDKLLENLKTFDDCLNFYTFFVKKYAEKKLISNKLSMRKKINELKIFTKSLDSTKMSKYKNMMTNRAIRRREFYKNTKIRRRKSCAEKTTTELHYMNTGDITSWTNYLEKKYKLLCDKYSNAIKKNNSKKIKHYYAKLLNHREYWQDELIKYDLFTKGQFDEWIVYMFNKSCHNFKKKKAYEKLSRKLDKIIAEYTWTHSKLSYDNSSSISSSSNTIGNTIGNTIDTTIDCIDGINIFLDNIGNDGGSSSSSSTVDNGYSTSLIGDGCTNTGTDTASASIGTSTTFSDIIKFNFGKNKIDFDNDNYDNDDNHYRPLKQKRYFEYV